MHKAEAQEIYQLATMAIKSLKSAVSIPILASSVLGLALLAMGIGFMAPTGEQSKLVYSGNMWCVSNYIQQEPTELLADGQPKRDPLLEGKDGWIRRDQITAMSAQEAMKKATQAGFFERSDKTKMREALSSNDKSYFTHHFNEGATAPGPCWGTGNASSPSVGYWINDAIKSECTGQDIDQTTSGSSQIGLSGNLSDGKKIRVNITRYSPCIRPYNVCDCDTGGDSSTADGTGKFAMKNGRLQWVKKDGTAEKYVFAEPTSDHIIPWKQRENYAVVIPGFNNNQPIRIRDHYAPGNHKDKNYLDLFVPCDELTSTGKVLSNLPSASGGQVDAIIVRTSATKSASSALGKIAGMFEDFASRLQVSASTVTNGTTNSNNKSCPTNYKSGPSTGKDIMGEIAKSLSNYYNPSSYVDQTESVVASGESIDLGKTAQPGGSKYSISTGSCHGSSLCHPGEKSGHGVYQNRGNGDAIDITPRDGYARAAFDGRAVSDGAGRNSFTVVTSTNGKVKAYYYHTINIKTGNVKAGDAIAKVGASGIKHIHFELLVNGKSVNGNPALKLNQSAYAASLWRNMKNVLGL